MIFTRNNVCYGLLAIVSTVLLLGGSAQAQESGYQTIDGTRVYTKIDHANQQATFSNDCGSQTISRSALQAGAKPTNIIPCPRPQSRESTRESGRDTPSSPGTEKSSLLWGATAAGIQSGNPSRVSVGSALNHTSESAAKRAAVQKCEENGISCQAVGSFTGCGYITVSKNAENVAWGSGPTAQAAYNNCYSRVKGGNCDTRTIGGCNKN